MKVKKVTIRGVDEELHKELRVLSIRLKVDMGQLINEAIRLRLKKEKKA